MKNKKNFLKEIFRIVKNPCVFEHAPNSLSQKHEEFGHFGRTLPKGRDFQPFKNKKGFDSWSFIIGLIIAVLALVIVVVMVFYLNKKNISIAEYLGNLFRFRGI